MGMWNFYTSYKYLAEYFWHIVASQGPVLKLLPCLSKENSLFIGLSWWRIKGLVGSSRRYSCGYFWVWSIHKAVVEWISQGYCTLNCVLRVGYSVSVCTPLTTATEVFLWLRPSLLWIRAGTVHVPLFVELPATRFHYFCYTLYLHLNILTT